MRNLWLSGAVAALVLSACTGGDDTPENPDSPVVEQNASTDALYGSFLSVANEDLVVTDASEADLSALVAALPDYVSLT